jgi:hypothetical protein
MAAPAPRMGGLYVFVRIQHRIQSDGDAAYRASTDLEGRRAQASAQSQSPNHATCACVRQLGRMTNRIAAMDLSTILVCCLIATTLVARDYKCF